jgi:hypothetical protein
LRKDVIHSRHCLEEDLWELSGLPQPKSGPGGGCPNVAGYNGSNKKPEDNKSAISDGTIDCYTTTSYPLATYAKAKYRRYGVYFELFVRGEERRRTVNTAHTCNDLRIEVNQYTLRKNGESTNNSISSQSKTYTGINQDYRKLRIYGGGKRLCNFYLSGRVGSRKVYGGTNWTYTPDAIIYFNYTP